MIVNVDMEKSYNWSNSASHYFAHFIKNHEYWPKLIYALLYDCENCDGSIALRSFETDQFPEFPHPCTAALTRHSWSTEHAQSVGGKTMRVCAPATANSACAWFVWRLYPPKSCASGLKTRLSVSAHGVLIVSHVGYATTIYIAGRWSMAFDAQAKGFNHCTTRAPNKVQLNHAKLRIIGVMQLASLNCIALS